ncbi:hypothetical protein BHE74_00046456 [Ensete ventricosum]|nr:hypothetical protein BHE74_00046456 [Ensete ventricosum]
MLRGIIIFFLRKFALALLHPDSTTADAAAPAHTATALARRQPLYEGAATPAASTSTGAAPASAAAAGGRPCRWQHLRAMHLPVGCLPAGAETVVGRPLQAGRRRPSADRWQQPLRRGLGRLSPLACIALQPTTLGWLPLWLGRRRAPQPCGLALAAAGRPFAWGPWLQLTAPCRGPGHNQPPPCRWSANPARGLVVAMPSCPLQGLPLLRKRSKNA